MYVLASLYKRGRQRTATYTTPNNDVLTMTAVMPSGTPSRTTACVYGTTASSGVFSNDLRATVEYPDLTTGTASTAAANDESYTYDALREKTSYTDRNGTSSLPPQGREKMDVTFSASSAFRGATALLSDPELGQGAAYWADEGGYVVEVRGAPWWDVNALLENKIPTPGGMRGPLMHGENELALAARVTPTHIVRVGRVVRLPSNRLVVEWIGH
jgi:hypothetical protein